MGAKRAVRKSSRKEKRRNLLKGGGPDRDTLNPTPPGVIQSGAPGAAQINRDEDLFRLFVSIFDDSDTKTAGEKALGKLNRERLQPQIGKPSATRFADIAELVNGGGSQAVRFTVEARKFLNEREAGNKAEKKRLRGGSNRTSSVIRAARGADTKTTALGRTALSGRPGRARNLVNDSSLLGQFGSLG